MRIYLPIGYDYQWSVSHCIISFSQITVLMSSQSQELKESHGGRESIRNLRLTNTHYYIWASQVAPVVKNPPANAGDTGSIPGSGRSLGKGNGNPPQYFCLVNPMDKGA